MWVRPTMAVRASTQANFHQKAAGSDDRPPEREKTMIRPVTQRRTSPASPNIVSGGWARERIGASAAGLLLITVWTRKVPKPATKPAPRPKKCRMRRTFFTWPRSYVELALGD